MGGGLLICQFYRIHQFIRISYTGWQYKDNKYFKAFFSQSVFAGFIIHHKGRGHNMRIITKDIQLTVGGSPQGFRLTKPDAFSGVEILRLLLRLQNANPEKNSSVLELTTSLSSDELRSVMTSCLNHTEVLLPAGPHPVMTGSE